MKCSRVKSKTQARGKILHWSMNWARKRSTLYFLLQIVCSASIGACGGGGTSYERRAKKEIEVLEQLMFARFLEGRLNGSGDALEGNALLVKEEGSFLHDRKFSIENGYIIDPLKIPYRVRVSEGGLVEIWACGPDGVDDHGSRDDVLRIANFEK